MAITSGVTSEIRKEIADAADDISARIHELRSPKDAVLALLVAHVKLTLEDDMDRKEVTYMLEQYSKCFLDSYFGS